ncbi:MAG: hypothetical protein QOJ79_684 [Actinomycetota bacterium]|nr:hypothetical protein [Actinomycetota bacterium]
MSVLPRWTAVCCAGAAVVALSGCANVNGSGVDAPDPAKTLPAQIAADVKTDLGEYLVTPRAGTSQKDIQATIERLRGMPGVQSVDLKDGRVDLQFSGGSTPEQHDKAVKQLAALGTPEEGV